MEEDPASFVELRSNETVTIEESVAAKKRRKKKEKEKEKKLTEAALMESKENEGRVTEKKVPRHVREIQEALARRKEAEERATREAEERWRREEEERRKQEELEKEAEEARRRKKEREKEKLQRKRQEGKPLTAKQKEEARRLEAMRKQILANAQGDLPLPASNDTNPLSKRPVYQKKVKPKPVSCNQENKSSPAAVDFIESKNAEEIKSTEKQVEDAERHRTEDVNAESKLSEENLRSPICCIMGHVDAGKTKLLDQIRGTNVQGGEAGGITQQVGATFFPAESICERAKEISVDIAKLKVPGLLVIDTPGHEAFTNLRTRGSGLCDIAILVVDIMHGLERQTIESLNLLKMKNTDFIIALNKVDRLYGWKTCRNTRMMEAIEQQSKDVKNEFYMRLNQVITQFKEQGLNTDLYYERYMRGRYNIVPTSAITGEGIPDLLWLLVQWCQRTMVEKLTYSDQVQCNVLEVKVVEGLGKTIDVVLVNGVLREGDQIVVCGKEEPIVTTIRSLLTPHPMKELRVKGTYLHHKEIKAAQFIKVMAQGLERAVAGTSLHVVRPQDDLEAIKVAAMEDVKSVMRKIDKSGEGVRVHASTLGSLEALLDFLKTPEVNIPVGCASIDPVHKKDVIKASTMLEKKKEFASILAFDVKVTREARQLAKELGVKIFTADVIYHLSTKFKADMDNLTEEKKADAADEAVFPCVLQILADNIFNKKDPIILGADVLAGIAKVGTPICVPQRGFIDIGRIASIQNSNGKSVDSASKGQEVTIKIVGTNPEEQKKIYGRHFKDDDQLVSHISRRSIDLLKDNYLGDLSREEWDLVKRLEKIFKIL